MINGWNENNLVSIDEPIYNHEGETFTYADLIPVEDTSFETVEDLDAYKKILNEYKFRYNYT